MSELTKHYLTTIENFQQNSNKLIYKKAELQLDNRILKLLIVKQDDDYKVMEAFCPHQGYPLYKSKLIDIEEFGVKFGTAIKCPAHFWCFSLDNGQCDRTPHKLKIFGNVVEGDELFVFV